MANGGVNWENLPSTNTPVNAENLNKLFNKAINVTTAGTNLNDYKSDGEWYFGVDYTPTNIPAGSNGWLKVITGIQRDDNVVKQIWYRHGTPNNNDYETYVRTFSGGAWSSWQKFVVQSEISDVPRTVRVTWSNSISFNLPGGHQALVLVSHTNCLLLWHSGGGLDYSPIYGTNVQATISGDVVTVKRSDNGNFTGTAVIF